MNWINLIILLPLLILLLCFGIAYVLRFKKHNKNNEGLKGNLFSIIIPFKDEKENIIQLIDFLIDNKTKFDEVIFIDDHSEDNSFDIVKRRIGEHRNFHLTSNDDSQVGKKAALQNGLKKARNIFVLTWDADITPNSDYFIDPLEHLKADLIIFPVIMKAEKNIFSSYCAYEYNLLSALNYLFSPIIVITASGANLFFDKSLLTNAKDFYQKNIVSGDDHYLLREFQKKGKRILVSNQLNRSVYTKSVNSFGEYFKQRTRWLGKFKYKLSFLDILIGAFFTYWFTIPLFLLLLILLGNLNIMFLVFVILIQYVTYLIIQYNYERKLGNILLPLFFTISYPVLFIMLLFKVTTYKNTW